MKQNLLLILDDQSSRHIIWEIWSVVAFTCMVFFHYIYVLKEEDYSKDSAKINSNSDQFAVLSVFSAVFAIGFSIITILQSYHLDFATGKYPPGISAVVIGLSLIRIFLNGILRPLKTSLQIKLFFVIELVAVGLLVFYEFQNNLVYITGLPAIFILGQALFSRLISSLNPPKEF